MRVGAALAGARSRLTALAQGAANITPAACTAGASEVSAAGSHRPVRSSHTRAQETGPGAPSSSGATGAEKPTGTLHREALSPGRGRGN